MRKLIIGVVVVLTMIITMFTGCGNRIGIPEGEPIITEEVPTETPTEPVIVCGTVNTDKLNVRKEPYIDARVLRQMSVGTHVEILEQKVIEGILWGRIEVGWINLKYVDIDTSSME